MNHINKFIIAGLLVVPLFAYSQSMNEIGRCVGAIDEAALNRNVDISEFDINELKLYKQYSNKITPLAKRLKSCFGQNPNQQIVESCLNQLTKSDRDFFEGTIEGKRRVANAKLGNRLSSDLSPTLHRLCFLAQNWR